MIELTRKIEVRDIINALAGVAVPVQQIIAAGKIQPGELYRIEVVMQGLLALRQVLDVQDSNPSVGSLPYRRGAEHVRADLLALATEVLEKTRCLRSCGIRREQDVEWIIDKYCDALEAALHALGDSTLEPHFRVALRWTTP